MRWRTAPEGAAGAQIGFLLLRIALAVVIFPHGAQKVFGWFGGAGFDATLDFFGTSFGVPAPVTMAVMAAELLGPPLLLLGLLTRLAALGIAAVMVGAIAMVHLPNGFFMDWQNTGAGEGYEYHLLALGIALALVAGGSGRFGLDERRRRRRAQRRS